MASKYELFFREADKDASGFLTLDELIQLLRQKGYKASDEKIKVKGPFTHIRCALLRCASKTREAFVLVKLQVGRRSSCAALQLLLKASTVW